GRRVFAEVTGFELDLAERRYQSRSDTIQQVRRQRRALTK
ncbi:MAG: hypothetical protein JWR24_4437, partial [Actinoallomurus sp.]|nr:hypothetical protein [Actinoallomurus sp.]